MNCSKLSNCVLLGIAMVLFLGLWYGIFCLLSTVFPEIAAGLLTVFLFHKLMFYLCQQFVFPGSIWLWKRNIETYYQKIFVGRTKSKINDLKDLIYNVSRGKNSWDVFLSVSDRKEIQKTITNVLDFFEKLITVDQLNKSQHTVMEHFTSLRDCLQKTNLVVQQNEERISFWDFLSDDKINTTFTQQDPNQSNSKETLKLEFENGDKSFELLEACENLKSCLSDLVSEKSQSNKSKNCFYDKFDIVFGTLNHLKEELMNHYICQQIYLNVPGGATLDCMLVAGNNYNGEKKNLEGNSQELQLQNIDYHTQDKTSNPTMILCSPNAGYYEYLCYENQWIDIYLKNGFNVFLWNYRGYGNSTGGPDPQNLREDGEVIVDYLREKLGVKIIGCHGQSMGGLVATHLARWKQIDFLCVDRTFESLSRMGNFVAGRFFSVCFRMLTLWEDRMVSDFLEANCYKVITFDPKDEVIPFLCSLMRGIVVKVKKSKSKSLQDGKLHSNCYHKFYNPLRILTWFQRLGKCIKKEFSSKDLGENDVWVESLSKEQVQAIFQSLNRVYSLFDLFRRGKKTMSMKRLYTGPVALSSIPKKLRQPKQNTGDSNDSIPLSPGEADDQSNFVNHGGSPTLLKDKAKQFDEEAGKELLSQSKESSLSQSLSKTSYSKLFDQEAQNDSSLIELLESIFSVCSGLEFGGISLDFIMRDEENRFEAFQYFLACFEVWGSYNPLQIDLRSAPKDVEYHRKKGLKKLKNFRMKIKTLIDERRLKEQQSPSPRSQLILLILEDLESINLMISTLTDNFINQAKSSNESQKIIQLPQAGGIELISANSKEKKCNLEDPLLKQSSQPEGLSASKASTFGYLIPLTCGHVGDLRPNEVEVYEYYLKSAKLTPWEGIA